MIATTTTTRTTMKTMLARSHGLGNTKVAAVRAELLALSVKGLAAAHKVAGLRQ